LMPDLHKTTQNADSWIAQQQIIDMNKNIVAFKFDASKKSTLYSVWFYAIHELQFGRQTSKFMLFGPPYSALWPAVWNPGTAALVIFFRRITVLTAAKTYIAYCTSSKDKCRRKFGYLVQHRSASLRKVRPNAESMIRQRRDGGHMIWVCRLCSMVIQTAAIICTGIFLRLARRFDGSITLKITEMVYGRI
jgi:hypothetical protein